MLSSILPAITRGAHAVALIAVKHAPAILTYGGIGLTTAGTAVAVKKSVTYYEDVTEEILTEKALVEEHLERDESPEAQETLRKFRAAVWSKLLVRTAKHYAVPAALYTCGVVCIIAGHRIGMRRVAALGAAYSSLQAAHNKLKSRVEDSPDLEAPIKAKLLDPAPELGPDDEYIPGIDPYVYMFDENNSNWSENRNISDTFLSAQRLWLNQRFHAHGYLFLNDVLDALGYEKTQEGQVLGWSLADGDDYISFGMCVDEERWVPDPKKDWHDTIDIPGDYARTYVIKLGTPHNILGVFKS